jgi:hypothetical protein
VKAILGLIEDDGARMFKNLVRHFFSSMRRQTVEEQRIRCSSLKKVQVDLIGGEHPAPFGALGFVSHRSPDVRVNHIGSRDGFEGIGGHDYVAVAAGIGKDLLRKEITVGTGDAHRATRPGDSADQ